MQMHRLFSLALIASIFHSCSDERPVTKITKPIITDEIPEVKVEPAPVFVIEEEAELEKKEQVEVKVERELSKMEKMLQSRTVYIAGGEAVRVNIDRGVEHYICYFTGEWSGKCKENLPVVKQFYADYVKNNPKVELIMVSADEPKWLIKWGSEEKFEWPLIFGESLSVLPSLLSIAERYAYYFVMFDKDGNQLQTVTLEDCIELLEKQKTE